jgi:hypothetical protein
VVVIKFTTTYLIVDRVKANVSKKQQGCTPCSHYTYPEIEMKIQTVIALFGYLVYNLMCLNLEQQVCDINSIYLTSTRYGDSNGRPAELKLGYKTIMCI